MKQWEIQVAVFARLSAYAPLSAFVSGRIYDDVPQATQFPYVVIGESDSIPFDDDVNDGEDTDLTIHVWSRYAGRKEIKQMMGAIYGALHRYALPIIGAHTVLMDFDYQNSFLDPDGTTRHGVIRFRLLTTHS